MELSELKNKICESFTGSQEYLQEILNIVEKDPAVFPFNEYEHLICNLIEKDGLTYEQYLEIRTDESLVFPSSAELQRYLQKRVNK